MPYEIMITPDEKTAHEYAESRNWQLPERPLQFTRKQNGRETITIKVITDPEALIGEQPQAIYIAPFPGGVPARLLHILKSKNLTVRPYLPHKVNREHFVSDEAAAIYQEILDAIHGTGKFEKIEDSQP